jgi:hypothetical protein
VAYYAYYAYYAILKAAAHAREISMITSRRQQLRDAIDSPSGIRRVSVEPVEFDPLCDLRQPFVTWFDARVQLDAKAVALRLPPRWCTTVTGLYADFCAWMFDRQQAPPTSQQFRNLLLELCCELRGIGDEEFVLNVALREDVQAHERFQQPPPPPAKRRRAARRRT